jgi:Tfp pilus assembly protein PilF
MPSSGAQANGCAISCTEARCAELSRQWLRPVAIVRILGEKLLQQRSMGALAGVRLSECAVAAPLRAGAVLLLTLMLSACPSLRSPPPFPQSPSAGSAGSAQPPQNAPAPPARPQRQYHLGPASTSLVAQAHKQAAGGDYGLAAATIERAMRIEPDNPLLWIELGRVRLNAGDNSQADSMGRKALASATGDPQAQASAWRLIADSLRALKRNDEAAQADRRANALAPR